MSVVKLKTQLKECPFCGENTSSIMFAGPDYAIECQYCGAMGPWKPSDTDAAIAWNGRGQSRPDKEES